MKLPLVTVGVPTFNRPAGLRRTLEQICGQSYRNLEIIVSDNASTDSEVMRVGLEYAARDPRVRFVRQHSNIGALANFRHLVQLASGHLFMWAADDDEWSESFIEECARHTDSGCSVMTGFETVYRATGRVERNPMPSLATSHSRYEDILAFLECVQPSLMYGLHHRHALSRVFDRTRDFFDFFDCHLVLSLIAARGFHIIERPLYRAGIDAAEYEVKYADGGNRRQLRYWPFFRHGAYTLAACPALSNKQKIQAINRLGKAILEIRAHHARH